jgi:hypothetical protein
MSEAFGKALPSPSRFPGSTATATVTAATATATATVAATATVDPFAAVAERKGEAASAASAAGNPFAAALGLFGTLGGTDWRVQAAKDSDAEIARVIARLKGLPAEMLEGDFLRRLEVYEAEAARRERARERYRRNFVEGGRRVPTAGVSSRRFRPAEAHPGRDCRESRGVRHGRPVGSPVPRRGDSLLSPRG